MVPGLCGCCCPPHLPSLTIRVTGCAYESLAPDYWRYHVVVKQGTTTLVDTYYGFGESHTYDLERGKSYDVTITNPNGVVKHYTIDATGCIPYSVVAIFLDQLAILIQDCGADLPPDIYTFTVDGVDVTPQITFVGSPTLTYLWTPTADYSGVAYTIGCTWAGRTQIANGRNLCQVAFGWVSRLAVCVLDGCTQLPFPGVSVVLQVNGVVASVLTTTDAGGSIEFNRPDILYGCVPGDTVGFACSVADYAPTAGEVVLPSLLYGTLDNFLAGACRVTYDPTLGFPECAFLWKIAFITLVPDDGHCCPLCGLNDPDLVGAVIGKTLTLNDTLGNVTLTADDSCTYTGCAIRPAPNTFPASPARPACDSVAADTAVYFWLRGVTLYAGIRMINCIDQSYPFATEACGTPPDPRLPPSGGYVWTRMFHETITSCVPTSVSYTVEFCDITLGMVCPPPGIYSSLGYVYGFATPMTWTVT